MTRKNYAIVFTTTLALVAGYFVLLTPGEAQTQPEPPPPNVFTPLDIPDWQDPQLPGDTPILRRTGRQFYVYRRRGREPRHVAGVRPFGSRRGGGQRV